MNALSLIGIVLISFCRCRVESKRRKIRRVKHKQTVLTILPDTVFVARIALAVMLSVAA
jgi:hypothetical protein